MSNWTVLYFCGSNRKEKKKIPITGPVLQAKAINLHKKLQEARGSGPMEEFKASTGWLWRFCKCHNIRQLSMHGKKLSSDCPAADQFIRDFKKFVNDSNYCLHQVFNCDETSLYYKLLPTSTLAAHFKKSADGRKIQKECVTISACSNATGTIKLPLLFIGKAKKFTLLQAYRP